MDFSMQIHAPSGWLELEDLDNGYELHKEATAQQAVTMRKQDIDSPYVEGTYTNEAVRGNVVEAVVVWVRGATTYEVAVRTKVLTDAFKQLQYEITTTFDDLVETWTCFPADYTIELSQEFRHSFHALVRASVPRLPAVVQSQVVP